jgi:hypothetical protein
MSKSWARRRPRSPAYEWCEPQGKQLHRRMVDAKAAQANNEEEFGRSYRIYRCPHGPHFHLTTQGTGSGGTVAP